VPVLFLHGGPGSGCSPRHRQLFDPVKVRAILFDQRGCGRSTFGHNGLQANNTQALLGDIERLRLQLGVGQWLVVGGSWGGGLALAYASAHPQACLGAVLRAVFLCRPSDLHWFFKDARQCLPDAWAAFMKAIPAHHQGEPGPHLYEVLLQGDAQDALPLARAWSAWENALTERRCAKAVLTANDSPSDQALLSKYRLQSHYLKNQCFFPSEGLLGHLEGIKNCPIDIIHGRLDLICRPESAWTLHQALPSSRLSWVDQAGHSLFEADMARAVVQTIALRVDELRTRH
jgi:proline iminopeptidase